jgi:predicted PurR-regulated permease PerM
MNSNLDNMTKSMVKTVLILLTLAAGAYFLTEISSVIAYIAIALILAMAGRPIVMYLTATLKVPSTFAALITIALFITIFVLFFWMMIPVFMGQEDNISSINWSELQQSLQLLINQLDIYLQSFSISYLHNVKVSELLSSIIPVDFISSFFNGTLALLENAGVSFFCIAFILFFFLQDSNIIHQIIFTVFPEKKASAVDSILQSIDSFLSKYVLGLCLQVSILFIIYSSVLLFIGVKSALIIALFCALLNLAPYIGPLVSAGVIIILTMTNFISADFSTVVLPNAGYALFGYLIAQGVDNFISQPLIFSKSSNSHPLEVFLIILLAGTWFGIIGMILAVPVYTIFKIIAKQLFPEQRIIKALTQGIS